jgi:Fur family transcriptional regulator, ferric uptake regulator
MKKKQLEPVDVEALLQEHGFKITTLRTTLLTILSESSRPLPVATLIKKTKRLAADPATIYRAMNSFVDEGIVNAITLSDRTNFYELVRKSHSHHIVCMSCNTIESLPFCIRGLEQNAQSKSKLFKLITAHTLSFLGTCKKCARTVR